MSTIDLETPHGLARAHLRQVGDARGALVLGHGAGGGVEAPDLQAAAEVAVSEGFTVALVEQPYRVAGRRSPAPAHQLDANWVAVAAQLAGAQLRDPPLVTGGRSLGARVACRTAEETGARAVLCLAFPLQPPARKGKEPSPNRLHELDAVKVPTLVVQGDRDRFGMPPAGRHRKVVEVAGDHSLRSDIDAVKAAVGEWLAKVADG